MSMSIGLTHFQKDDIFFLVKHVEKKEQTWNIKFPKLEGIKATKLLRIVHSYICGHIQTPLILVLVIL
jgi:hypothetical protein